jgi:hypothetical protein
MPDRRLLLTPALQARQPDTPDTCARAREAAASEGGAGGLTGTLGEADRIMPDATERACQAVRHVSSEPTQGHTSG